METIIKDIIDADRKARDRVEQIESQRYQLTNVLSEQRKKITAQFEEAAAQKKDQCKEELEISLAQHQKTSEQEYQDTMQALKKQFDKEKDNWVNEIYEHCLNKG